MYRSEKSQAFLCKSKALAPSSLSQTERGYVTMLRVHVTRAVLWRAELEAAFVRDFV
jgi:hypothetical protein